jgi:5'-3' exonuclease
MGIPFYFSYLIKNHRQILKKFNKNEMLVDNFFIDANPLIYNSINKENQTEHNNIVHSVINQIMQIIYTFSPRKKIYISFDGVAPVSKLEQQRGRRYKRRFELPDNENSTKRFNTIEITPGTPFMKYLNEELSSYFSNNSSFIYSGSNEYGEGEHKIFHYIRNNFNEIGNDTNVIYGLDADLIMLCLNHINYSNNIYLFRETPHFIQSIDETLEPNETYVLDISYLSTTVHSEVGMSPSDYIFSCFFLGNDFLPHFPALNIRTGGVTKIMDTFKELLEKKTNNSFSSFVNFTSNGIQVNWMSVKYFIHELSKKEKKYIENEIKLRDRKQKNYYPSSNREELQKKINELPSYERELEKSIDPTRKGWQERYYIALFGLTHSPSEQFIDEICCNYFEGLEWTLKYYTGDCPDWRWRYKYHYPPLLEDLLRKIPNSNHTFFNNITDKGPINEITQLCYVLPTENLDLIPSSVKETILRLHPEWYIGSNAEEDVDFIWAFCKYFFEAHPILPEINVDELERIIETL